jgi:hypothetical protein
MGTVVTDKNCVHQEIKRRLNSGNAWYHVIQYLLPSLLLPQNANVKTYNSKILPVIFMGVKCCLSH